MSKYTWTHEDIWVDEERLREAVEKSTSLRNTLVNLGIEPSAKRYKKLKVSCAKFNIPLDFPEKVSTRRIDDSLVFANPSVFERSNSKELKNRALALGYIEDKCECGQGPEWNGKPLTLQLDHIDGDFKNNLPENLKMLCPNCHTQTETYGYRNHKKEICKNGHPWTEENLWKRQRGNVCKICAKDYNNKARAKEKESKGLT